EGAIRWRSRNGGRSLWGKPDKRHKKSPSRNWMYPRRALYYMGRLLGTVLVHHGLHLIPTGLHVGHQLELGPAAVQVLAGPVGTEVMVSLQIVGEEADAALQRHQLGAPGQVVQ